MAKDTATGTWILSLETASTALREMRPTADGSGKVSVIVGQRTAMLEIEIDFDSLKQQLADRALRSPRKRSTMGAGAIVVKAVNVKDTQK